MTHSFWNRWFFGGFVQQTRRKQRRKPRRARPSIEPLETRALLSTVLPLETATPQFIIASPQAGISPLGGNGPAGGYTPSQITQAYSFNLISFTSNGTTFQGNGAGQTIAIVDAYNDPNINSDLQAFDAQFGLPNPTLTVIGQTGGTPPTATDISYGWEKEESLDVEWAHAIAPAANIVLVEANDANLDDLMTAVKTAANLSGVSVVSMSWEASEFSGETTCDSSYFSTPNVPADVAFIAASGDSGAPPIYPAASPNVLAVGGTTLTLTNTNGWSSETAWSGSGGGISSYEAQPSYQKGVVTQSSTQRTNPDVAYDADPNTGFSVYDSYPAYKTGSAWLEVSGTSDAAPQWAALVAIADQGRALYGESSLGYSQLLSDIYQMPASYFHDITSGSSAGNPSYSAGPGYDLVTGRGTPIANPIVNSLVGTSTYFVTSTADDGSTGTLRDAINHVNAGKFKVIDFNIAGTGVQTINLTSALPALTASGVLINGYSENQFQGVTSTSPLIELNGSSAGSSSDGLLLQGSNNTVSGLIIVNFSKNGIEVDGANNTIGGATTDVGNILSGNTSDGVLIDSGVSGVVVQGNYIGTNTVGGAALANSVGIEVAGSNNIIGGTTSGSRNIISGNSNYGLELDTGVSGVAVQGNFIGTDVNGSEAVANGVDGVHVLGSNNTIGGTSSAARNVISANTTTDVYIDSAASGVLVEGNYIGTDVTGSSSIGIGSIGIDIEGSADTVGGTVAGAGNVISGNSQNGVLIGTAASGVAVQGNYIGTDITGFTAVANATGVEVAGSNNTIGGTAAGDRNIISGNSDDGVLINSGASGVVVQGNYIGTDVTGNAALANQVGIEDAGSSNTIGGSVLGSRNVISGNSGDGVLLDSTATNETMQGNYIGTNVRANAALANGTNGIEVKGTGNTIGGNSGSNYFVRNFIAGNSQNGVLIASGASGNQVMGNFIGVDISGTHGLGNVNYGVSLAGSNNTLGGTSAAFTNVISGSSKDGILLTSTASGNLIQGNDVGTDYSGQKSVANSNGIEVIGSGNTLGGTASAARNLVSGNSSDGVLLDSGASGNVLLGNWIGINAINKALANSGNGLDILSINNTIGGTATGARNILSGNSKDGLLLASGASGNQVLGNYIGTDIYVLAALTNGTNGIEIDGSGNAIGGTVVAAKNIISGNTGDGVKIDSGASGNQVMGNYIGTNANGLSALSNGIGIEDGGSGNTLGGTVSGARNVLYGNKGDAILLDSTASGEAVQGNLIGFIATYGNSALVNGKNGVEVQGSNNTIGGTVLAERNYIAGSDNDGVLLGSSASGNLLLDNFIGIAVSGTIGVANLNGIEIAGTGNTIGGTVAGSTNVISASKSDGILIDSTGSGNLVLGNDVGTDYTGNGGGVANSGNGIEVAGTGNTLGGTASAARNIVSGNSSDGVKLDSTASGTVLLGNWIGVNAINVALTNSGNGLDVLSVNNTLGGTATGARNVLSGNGKDGLLIASGASGNQVLGNYIGVNIYRTAALANGSNGIEIASNGNTIGGTATAARNFISGNTGDGVKIDSGASGNQVLGNYIGTNAGASGAIANGIGVEDAGTSNTIGGSVNGARNIISGNTGDGILLDSTATGDAVWGNFLGLNVSGNGGLGNGNNGLEVQGSKNTVGGTILAERNYITGNTNDGLFVGNSSSGNLVLDNFIGVDQSGTHGVANLNGIEIAGTGNTIGGTVAGSTNVISASKSDGILIDSTGSGNLVLGNDVGPDYTGNNGGVANSGNGIEVAGTGNTLGGTVSAARNVFSGNSGDGVKIDSTGSGNVLLGNNIGVGRSGATLANSGNGVEIAGSNNTVGGSVSGAGNIISGNSKNGVLVSAGSGDTISRNSVFGNTVLGISPASGANNNIVAPTLSTSILSGITLTVTGSFTAPTANVAYVLEFFANLSGDAEGRIYLGSLTVTPTSTGTQNLTFTTTTTVTGTYPLITATLTDNTGDTSQFSNGVTVS